MSWFSNLAEAYDRVSDMVGIPNEKGNMLLPLYHMLKKTDVCVTIDANGKFQRAEKDKDQSSVCIPCTEDSAARAGKVVYPHPLHEQVDYIVLDEAKRSAYLAQLQLWSDRNAKVKAVYDYIASGTILDDLALSGIQEARTEKSLFIRFSVQADDLYPNLWEDPGVVEAWKSHCIESGTKEKTLCYVEGKPAPLADKHPKGINMSAYGAKLISCNDSTNFTYRGRFKESSQPNAIGVEATQKAHAMLKYLVASMGHKCDTQAIVAWAVDNGEAQPDPFASTDFLYGTVAKTEDDIFASTDFLYATEEKTDSVTILEAQGELDTDYSKKLRAALVGMGNAENLERKNRRVAVMAMDAATTGRMGITFYQDLQQNDYIERILDWHNTCKWRFRGGKYDYISAPSANRIIAAVYGEPKGEGYKKIQKQARERLLHHVVCGQPLDRGWVSAAITRVSQPLAYDKLFGTWEKGAWADRGTWENALCVTCAIVRKYYAQKKEEFDLELEKTRTDRGYLFGRLLAIADRLESHARYLQEGKTGGTEKRPTNAVRYMSAFSSKPLRTWALIFNQLNPYIQRLNGAEWYQKQIDEIMSLFPPDGFDDKPLDGKYLLGYSLQRRALTKKEDTSNEPDKKD